MRIATLNGWEFSAETEIEKRIKLTLNALGHDCVNLKNSTEITAYNPDLVISLSYHFPKTTQHPTVLALWSPSSVILSKSTYTKNFGTFDGFLFASPHLESFAQDFCMSSGKEFVGAPFYATCNKTEFLPADFSKARLVYAGTNWESRTQIGENRYSRLLPSLIESAGLTICGPRNRWDESYDVIDDIPFDGVSMLNEYRKHGVVLCLHSPLHHRENLPTVRPMEAVAAGCLPIIDNLKFYKNIFGNDAFYVDPNLSSNEMCERISSIIRWIRNNPQESHERAKRLHNTFSKGYCYDSLLADLPGMHNRILESQFYDIAESSKLNSSSVTYIVRCGGRSGEFLRRCLISLRDQSSGAPNVIVVKHGDVTRFEEIHDHFNAAFPTFTVIEADDDGPKSTRLWNALHHVKTEFFALLDDDDALHDNHVASLLSIMENNPDCTLAYSGTIRCWEGIDYKGSNEWKRHSSWPKHDRHSNETRFLLFYEECNRESLWYNNVVSSPCYIARTSEIGTYVGTDPKIDTAEDWLLVLLLARKDKFRFSYRATAEWYWRKSLSSNATFGKVGRRYHNVQRLRMRADASKFLNPKHDYLLSSIKIHTQYQRDTVVLSTPQDAELEAGWFFAEAFTDHVIYIIGQGQFDGLDYDQKILIHHPNWGDISVLSSFVASKQTNENSEFEQSLRCEKFNGFVVTIGVPDTGEFSVDELKIYTVDSHMGTTRLTARSTADNELVVSNAQKSSLMRSGMKEPLCFLQDGSLQLGRNVLTLEYFGQRVRSFMPASGKEIFELSCDAVRFHDNVELRNVKIRPLRIGAVRHVNIVYESIFQNNLELNDTKSVITQESYINDKKSISFSLNALLNIFQNKNKMLDKYDKLFLLCNLVIDIISMKAEHHGKLSKTEMEYLDNFFLNSDLVLGDSAPDLVTGSVTTCPKPIVVSMIPGHGGKGVRIVFPVLRSSDAEILDTVVNIILVDTIYFFSFNENGSLHPVEDAEPMTSQNASTQHGLFELFPIESTKTDNNKHLQSATETIIKHLKSVDLEFHKKLNPLGKAFIHVLSTKINQR